MSLDLNPFGVFYKVEFGVLTRNHIKWIKTALFDKNKNIPKRKEKGKK